MDQEYPQLPWSAKDKVIGKIYTYKDRQGIWNGKRLNCIHNNRFGRCKECKGEELVNPKKIFKNQGSIRLFMENLLSKITKLSNIDYETTKLWYQLNRQMVSKNGGNSLFKQYRTLFDILQGLYPNNRLYPCLFKTVPTNTWNDYKNHIIWVREFLKKMNITNYEDCYKIRNEDICNNGGASLLNLYHDCSVYTLFKNTLIYNWLPWKYTNAPQSMWIGGDIKNVKWYFKELYKDLDFTSLDDFYKIKKHTLIQNNGGGLLSIYNGSIYNLLHIAYPEYNWKFWKFSQAPQYSWENINNQRIFMDEFHTTLNISSQTEMYNVLLEEIDNYGGSTLTNTIYHKNIYKLYSSIYPEIEWDKRKWRNIGYSKGEIEWLEYLNITIPDIRYMLNHPEGQYRIPNSRYSADGHSEIKNSIYEYHGDKFHGNPNKFRKSTYPYSYIQLNPEEIFPLCKKTYGELYANTLKKKNFCEDAGYNYYSIWESDWHSGIRALIKLQRMYRKTQ